MAAYELKYTAEEIDGILESVDEKTIYGDATQSEHGLMSTTDKGKLDGLPDGRILSEALDSKVDKKIPSTAGNLAKITGEGNMADSGYSIDNFATEQQGRLADTAYQKPSSGIPKTDLASSVQTSLGKADTALQEHQDISGKQDTLVSGTNIKTVNGESLLGSGNIEIQGGGGEENVIEAITMNGASVPVTNKTAAITETDPTVPSWAKQQNKPSYQYSEIGNTPDLSGFITKSVNDLANYYLKSETYTKAEVEALIGAIQNFHYEFYASTSAVTNPQGNVLYLIGPIGSGSDKYEEYVYSNNDWHKIGDTSIDLSGYVTTSDLNTALAGYVTVQDLNDSKVFWVEAFVTTFAEIKDAVDAGRTVLLKDEDNNVYVLSHVEDDNISFCCASGEYAFLNTCYIDDCDAYEFVSREAIESQNNKVISISSSSDYDHYPSAKAVADYAQTISNKVTLFQSTPDDMHYPSEKLVKDSLDVKQNIIDSSNKLSADYIQDGTTNKVINVKPDWNAASGADAEILNKPTIPVAGIPSGGNASQVLKKVSSTDYDVTWANQSETLPSAYCTTSGSTAAKRANCSLYVAQANQYLQVLIGSANTYQGALTLNINSAGDKPIYINGTVSSSSNYTLPNGTYFVFYDGTNYYFRTDGKIQGPSGTLYIKPSTGIPASDLASGVIPSIPVQDVSLNDPASLEPNVIYDFGTITGTKTFPALGTALSGEASVYCYRFNTSSTAPNLTFQSNLKWAGGELPTINADKYYEVSIMDGIAIIVEASVPV